MAVMGSGRSERAMGGPDDPFGFMPRFANAAGYHARDEGLCQHRGGPASLDHLRDRATSRSDSIAARDLS
jgi:hypothetical protein